VADHAGPEHHDSVAAIALTAGHRSTSDRERLVGTRQNAAAARYDSVRPPEHVCTLRKDQREATLEKRVVIGDWCELILSINADSK